MIYFFSCLGLIKKGEIIMVGISPGMPSPIRPIGPVGPSRVPQEPARGPRPEAPTSIPGDQK